MTQGSVCWCVSVCECFFFKFKSLFFPAYHIEAISAYIIFHIYLIDHNFVYMT